MRGGARPGTGGKRPGAGRKRGSPNKASQQRQALVAASGITPLDFLLEVMRAPEPVRDADEAVLNFVTRLQRWYGDRLEGAAALAPYVHPRLAVIEKKANNGTQSQVRIELKEPGTYDIAPGSRFDLRGMDGDRLCGDCHADGEHDNP